jgi:spoIIIJ-associated protein
MASNNSELVRETIRAAMGKLGFEAEILERQEEDRVVFNIRTQDAKLLIGKQGSTLEALQYLVKVMVYRQLPEGEKFSFALDIDDYRDKRVIYLKDLARKAAQHVKQGKKAVSLVPMPPHERRVVHHYLSLYPEISSESTGKEPNRKVIIRYKKPVGTGFNFIEEN